MPLNKVGPGNMYQDFVTHTHSHLAGECPHRCEYCYVQSMARRFPALHDRYTGPVRLVEKELSVNYGTKKTIFMENCSDLFAEGIPYTFILLILAHANRFPENIYAFQTKNPGRIGEFLNLFPPRFLIGTTAESDFADPSKSQAPPVYERLNAMYLMDCPPERRFITIEPILQFQPKLFLALLLATNVPTFYIGADSKKHGLPEPTWEEIGALVRALREAGKTVVLKSNLKRLYKGE